MYHLSPVVRPAEVATLIRTNPAVRLLDVRTPAEYLAAHIEGAYNVPLDTLHEHAREIRASVTDPIVLVCQSGQRARRAEDSLKAAGLENLHVLEGGVAGWTAAGLPTRRAARTLSLERQVRIAIGSLVAAGGLLAAVVHPAFGFAAAFVGAGLVFAGVTDSCAVAMLLAKLPHNRPATCDVGAMVRALTGGRAPDVSSPRPGPPASTPRTCCS